MVEGNQGRHLTLNPMLTRHCLELAEEFLAETRPAVVAQSALVVVPAGPRAWYAIETVMHGEDKVVEALGDLGFESYVPMIWKEITHRRTRRPIMRQFRMFNRYLFAHLPLNAREWRTVASIKEINHILGQGGGCPIRDDEIERVRHSEAEGEFNVTKARQFPIGSRVRVTGGPFGGFSGLVESLPGKGIVKAVVELLGGLVPVQFPFDQVELE